MEGRGRGCERGVEGRRKGRAWEEGVEGWREGGRD